MDSYTAETQKWLDDRFRRTDEKGVYVAHQPIYGWRRGPCEDDVIRRYIITYQIMKALGHLEFSSLLDVGGAEGYKAALVRKVFNVPVRSCDLSAEASRRAHEIFGVPGEPVDIANLPHENNSFDIALCSETLEHVTDIQRATRELLRVAKRAVVITIPKERKEDVERNIRDKVPHGHIHALDLASFAWVEAEGARVIGRPISSRGLLSFPMKVLAAEPDTRANRSAVELFLHNKLLVPFGKAVLGKYAAAKLLEMDDRRSSSRTNSRGLLFILLKDAAALRKAPVQVSASQVLDFEVPFHYPLRNAHSAGAASVSGRADR